MQLLANWQKQYTDFWLWLMPWTIHVLTMKHFYSNLQANALNMDTFHKKCLYLQIVEHFFWDFSLAIAVLS